MPREDEHQTLRRALRQAGKVQTTVHIQPLCQDGVVGTPHPPLIISQPIGQSPIRKRSIGISIDGARKGPAQFRLAEATATRP